MKHRTQDTYLVAKHYLPGDPYYGQAENRHPHVAEGANAPERYSRNRMRGRYIHTRRRCRSRVPDIVPAENIVQQFPVRI